jgi:hypothetical protein
MKTNAILLDVGVLLTELDDEFNSYNGVYNHRYGYYDENQIAYKGEDLIEAIKYAREYVANGVDMTYAVITTQGIVNYDEPWENDRIEDFTYNAEDVIFSVAKIYGIIIEDFIEEAHKC